MKKTIAFVTSGIEFNGGTLKEKSMGGSESAMIYMAKEIAALGNDVTVYCDCDRPGVYDGVDYRSNQHYMQDDKAQFDVLIVSRCSQYFTAPLDTKLNILWCHDSWVHHMDYAIGLADITFCLSEYHKQTYLQTFNIKDPDYIWKTSNGYDSTIPVTVKPFSEKKNQYIYASRPERGLRFLLETVWPEIYRRNPDARLNVCSYINNLQKSPEMLKEYEIVEKLLNTVPGVIKPKHLTKTEYYSLLSDCAYMIYPTDFDEISCINAMEAQYAGCLVVTTDKYALSETVKTNTKVKSTYGSTAYVNEFLDILQTYQGDKYDAEVAKGRELISTFDWKHVAASWDAKIDELFKTRFEKNKNKIIDKMVYNSDIVAAYKLTNDAKYKAMIDQSMTDNLTSCGFIDQLTEEDQRLCNRALGAVEVVKSRLEKYPGKKLTILDLGSNQGLLSLPVLKRHSSDIESIVLYDSSEKVLNYTKETFGNKYPQMSCIVDDVRNVLSHDIKPDVVFVGELLEHIEDTHQFLNFLMQLSTGNTLFYFTVPRGPWETINQHQKEIYHIHHFELSDIKQIFNNVDLTVTRSTSSAMGRHGEPCDNWMFWFEGNTSTTFGEVDYQDKWLKTRPYKTVSGLVITDNSADYLEKCLKSIDPIVDEIIVVDMGSTDNSREIAAKFTDKIFDAPVSDSVGDNSEVKNFAIRKATSDFCLFAEPSEKLLNSGQLRRFITSDYYDAIAVRTHNAYGIGDSVQFAFGDPTGARLFKSDLAYTGVVHEYLSKNNSDIVEKTMQQEYAVFLQFDETKHNQTLKTISGKNSALVQKNATQYPYRLIAQYYLLVDLFAQVMNTDNYGLIGKFIEQWETKIKPSREPMMIKMAINEVIKMYQYCHINGIPVNGNQIQVEQMPTDRQDQQPVVLYYSKPEEKYFFMEYLNK